MRSVVCIRPGLMELEDRETPTCGSGEALLRIRRIGICGTDIHAYGGNQPYFSYPRVLGHELAGEIVEVPEAMPRWCDPSHGVIKAMVHLAPSA